MQLHQVIILTNTISPYILLSIVYKQFYFKQF